jgi:LytS/YehU family sensor histidine kinase
LQPHFLFNTLNAIMVLVRQQRGRQAEEMLARLSDLLRCVLEDVDAQQIPLRKEFEYLRLYLSIEQVRFQDRLGIQFSADDSALEAAVPHMALQPIVENAVRHGIGRVAAAGTIRISASHTNQTLVIRVADDGPGLGAADLSAGCGIGLANTRSRLQQLYGDAASLRVENGERGVVATITLPYRAADELQRTGIHAFDSADRG